MNEELAAVSMQIILNAGDARACTMRAIEAIGERRFSDADAELATAKDFVGKAHRAQTEVIQANSRGEVVEIDLLFTHAQDTLMTVKSERDVAAAMAGVFRAMDARITEALEAAR